jgi:hypothetical protein
MIFCDMLYDYFSFITQVIDLAGQLDWLEFFLIDIYFFQFHPLTSSTLGLIRN